MRPAALLPLLLAACGAQDLPPDPCAALRGCLRLDVLGSRSLGEVEVTGGLWPQVDKWRVPVARWLGPIQLPASLAVLQPQDLPEGNVVRALTIRWRLQGSPSTYTWGTGFDLPAGWVPGSNAFLQERVPDNLR